MKKSVRQLDLFPHYGRDVAQMTGLRKLAYTLVPRHTLFPFWLELHTTWMRLRTRRAYRQYMHARDLLVNLGAGDQGKPGWVNVDAVRSPGINCVYDCRTALPFPDDSVRGIFCEHFFEHLDYTEEVPSFLTACHRVLQPGGVLRLIVPDAERYLRAYCEGGWQELDRLRQLDAQHADPVFQCVYNTRMELINMVFRQGHQHKFAYDYETMAFLLRRYGFTRVEQQRFGVSLRPELSIDRADRASESLYVEAVK
jgi:predicted SAM-dependent methyltransferase